MSASKTKRCSCSGSSGYSSQSLTSEHDAKQKTSTNSNEQQQQQPKMHSNQKYIKHNCKTLNSLTFSSSSSKPASSSTTSSSCALDTCSRSSSTNICNQTSHSNSLTNSSESSCCIRTSTPTIASLQLFVNNNNNNNTNQSQTTSHHYNHQNVNYNYSTQGNSTFLLPHPFYNVTNTSNNTKSSSANLNAFGIQQQKIYQSGLNKNLVASISTITSECGDGGGCDVGGKDSTSSPRTFSTNTNTNTTSKSVSSSSTTTTSGHKFNSNTRNYSSNFIYPISQVKTPLTHNSHHHNNAMHRPLPVVQVVQNQKRIELQKLPTTTMTTTQKKSTSFLWTFFSRLLACFNVFNFFRKTSNASKLKQETNANSQAWPTTNSTEKLNSFPINNTYSEMNKHRPVYNTSSNYYNNYQINASTLFKSKHSTPIRTETDLKLNLISPVPQKLNETNSNLPSSNSNNKNTNSTNNSSHLAYIDADSQLDIENEEETYDNLPPQKQQPQSKQQDQSNGMVKLQLLMLKSQPMSRSSPVLLLNDHQKYHYHIHGNDYEEEHYIKINPLHLKLKQIKLEASSSLSLTSLPKNNVLVNSTESLEEDEDSTTNYDNDLAEILAKRQQQETQLSLSSESLVTTKKHLQNHQQQQNRTNVNQILNEANSFESLSSVALSSMSSMSGSINLQNETQNVYSMQVKFAGANSTSTTTTTSSLTKNSFVNTNSSRGDYCLSLMNLTQKNKQQAILPQHNLVKKVQLKYPVTIQRRNTNIIEYNPQPAKDYYKQQQHQSSQHKQQLHHRHQTHSRSTQRHQSFNLRRKTTGSIMGANGAPIYEDYLCDKEVESYFDNPVYLDSLKNSQKLLNFPINMLPLQQQQLHPPPPIISASLYSQHSVVTTDAPLNLLTKSNNNNHNKSVVLHKAKCLNASNFLVKPNVIRNGSVSFSSLSLASSSSSSSSNTTSSNNSVTLTKSLIGAGIIRQNQGESYC